MKFEEAQGGADERLLLTAMVVDGSVLARLHPKWQPGGLFQSKWANLVGGWCIKYYGKYGKPPARDVEGMFKAWAAGQRDTATVATVEAFLADLSGAYRRRAKAINPDYVLDVASRHFNAVRASGLAQAVQGHIELGDPEKAVELIGTFSKVDVSASDGVDVLLDVHLVDKVLSETQMEPVVQYPGALGKFFGRRLARDCFVSFLGPEKRGKSYWLGDLAWRAAMQRRRVAVFQVGDMSEPQVLERFYERAALHPRHSDEGWPLTVKVPYEWEEYKSESGKPAVRPKYKEKVFKGPLSTTVAREALARAVKEKVRSSKSHLRLYTHPNNTIGADGVRAQLRTLAAAGWVPDVVVIDYADLLSPPPGFRGEPRDAINETWKTLRSISQEFHCLLATATQADAKSYTQSVLNETNFSEDKRKGSHVTAMFTLNQLEHEKRMGVMRLGQINTRTKQMGYVTVAGCLEYSSPAVISRW